MEVLSWKRMVTNSGIKLMQPTIPRYHKLQLMDYIPITIITNKDKSDEDTIMTHSNILTIVSSTDISDNINPAPASHDLYQQE